VDKRRREEEVVVVVYLFLQIMLSFFVFRF